MGLCKDSGYQDNEDEIKNTTVMISLNGDSMAFSVSTARKITVGHHQSIIARGSTIEECLSNFENEIKVIKKGNDIELR